MKAIDLVHQYVVEVKEAIGGYFIERQLISVTIKTKDAFYLTLYFKSMCLYFDYLEGRLERGTRHNRLFGMKIGSLEDPEFFGRIYYLIINFLNLDFKAFKQYYESV